MSSPLRRDLLLGGVGLALFIGIVSLGGWPSRTALRPALLPLSASFLTTIGLFWIGSLRWGLLVNASTSRPIGSYKQLFLYFVLGRAVGYYSSQLGSDLMVRPLLLRGFEAVPVRQGVVIGLWEKGLDFLFAVVLAGPAGLWLTGRISEQGFLVASLLALALPWGTLLLSPPCVGRVLAFGMRAVRRIPFVHTRIKGGGDGEEESIVEDLDSRLLWKLLGLTTLKYAALVLRAIFLIEALNLSIPIVVVWSALPLVQLSLVLAFTPGALGVLEGGWYAVLLWTGVPQEIIGAFLVGQRLYWTLFATLLLGMSLGVWALLRGYRALIPKQKAGRKEEMP